MKFCVQIKAFILAQFLYCVASAGEADYTLDDSFWNEESPAGEVERLLREYRQNQELVRRIGGHYYQIIYPVQLRHHEKMGISTREVSPSKPGRGPAHSEYRGRTRKHFHRTSLLIKAFNHKFRLDLELNSQLLSPNIQQKHYHQTGFLLDSNRHDIEHCYYHGTVKDYPGASAAFHTCNGVSGVIHVGNETFVIHPFYGGDLSKHPHVIFEARTKANKGCANSGNLDTRRLSRRTKHLTSSSSAVVGDIDPNGAGRYKRDVRDLTKYIETAIIVDRAMFEKRNGSTRAEIIHDAIQVANIADLYFRTLNTRVSVVYIETWGKNQAVIDGKKDIGDAIKNFNDYILRNLYKTEKDTTQLLTGETFVGGEAGMAAADTICTPKAVGISVDINVYEPHLLAGTMAHMIGHNIGMGHDDGREECVCRDWHGCIMAQSIVGLENVQPYKFSECSKNDYIESLRGGQGLCLLNKPNEIEVKRNCGNKIIEEEEECDCGSLEDCIADPCCDGITCKLKSEAECAAGACCSNCKLREKGTICRDTVNECDLPEFCDGESGNCPSDSYKKNGSPCGHSKNGTSLGYCFHGDCPTLALQCEGIWGYGGYAADRQCYEQFNSKGSINGHCGKGPNGQYLKCDIENVQCGTLQCKDGERSPVNNGIDQLYSRTIISIKGVEYECKATSGEIGTNDYPQHGLVRDGTPCGENLICINQTCVSIHPHIDQTKCPTDQNGRECSNHGVCTNMNRCYCDLGYGGIDCSFKLEMTTPLPHHTTNKQSLENTIKMEKKETPYESYHGSDTVFLVGVLMSVVGFVFVAFTLMALCYRKKTTTPITAHSKYDTPYMKKPITKSYGIAGNSTTANHHSVEEISLDGDGKLVYGNQTGGFRDHKPVRRLTGSASEEDQGHSEKGILKKHGYTLALGDQIKDKWGDDGQSDNMELMAQQDVSGGVGIGVGGAAASEVERTLKSLNGYHEDILEALRNAASHRGTGAGNTPVGSNSFSEEMLRKTLQECTANNLNYGEYKRGGSTKSSRENICDANAAHAILIEGVGGLGSSGGMIHQHHHRSQHHLHQAAQQQQQQQQQAPLQQGEDDDAPATGPLRIRNLEDLIRQLEQHSSRHMSPSGSEDIRMSETEADRHYRLDSSAACSESSQGSTQQLAQSQKTATIHPPYGRCRPRPDDENNRFVYSGRYRHPPPQSQSATNRQHQHPSHSPHAYGHHTHHSHSHGHSTHGPHSSHHSSHTHLHQDDDAMYESAEHHTLDPRETPDSESDDFIKAQQQLARWASEDVVSVVVLDPGSMSDSQQQLSSLHHHHQSQQPISVQQQQQQTMQQQHQQQQQQLQNTIGHTQQCTAVQSGHILQHHGGDTVSVTTGITQNNMQQQQQQQMQQIQVTTNGINPVQQRDYYPSPPSTTETESSGSVIPPTIQQRRSIILDSNQIQMVGDGQLMENGRYPEYKH